MTINTTFREWAAIAPHTDFKMDVFSRPSYVGAKPTPKDLSHLSIGQLISLSELKDMNESFYDVVCTCMDIDRTEVAAARAVDVVRFVGWVCSEVRKINKLFDQVRIKPTQREEKAGVKNLQFGLFGMLDWYAVRMRIPNHDDVLNTPWMRIYKCMDIDNRKRLYEIRLQQVIADEIKHNR